MSHQVLCGDCELPIGTLDQCLNCALYRSTYEDVFIDTYMQGEGLDDGLNAARGIANAFIFMSTFVIAVWMAEGHTIMACSILACLAFALGVYWIYNSGDWK